MPELWTGDVVGKMHTNKITNMDMADELGVTPEYVSMVLNGKRSPQQAEQKFRAAVDAIADRKSGELLKED